MRCDISIAELSYCDELTNPDADTPVVALVAGVDMENGETLLFLSTVQGLELRDPFIRALLSGTPPGLTRVIDSIRARNQSMTGMAVVEALSDVLMSSLFVSKVEQRTGVSLPGPTSAAGIDADTLFNADVALEAPARLLAS